MILRIFSFFLIVTFLLWLIIHLVIRYTLPIFSKIERDEKRIYKKWIKLWR